MRCHALDSLPFAQTHKLFFVKNNKTPKAKFTGLVSEFNVKTDLVGLVFFLHIASIVKYTTTETISFTEDCKYLPREVFQSYLLSNTGTFIIFTGRYAL